MRGNAIRALRRRHGWTQAELAERLGTDPVTVSRWERGVSHPRSSARTRLRELSEVLPKDLSSLIRSVGQEDAHRVLRRVLLLSARPSRRRFAADPARRLREIERARREQLDLKKRVRLAR